MLELNKFKTVEIAWNNLNANRDKITLARVVPPALLGKLHAARVSLAWELRGSGGCAARGALSLTRRAHAAFLPCSLGAASQSSARNPRPSVVRTRARSRQSRILAYQSHDRVVCDRNFSPAAKDTAREIRTSQPGKRPLFPVSQSIYVDSADGWVKLRAEGESNRINI